METLQLILISIFPLISQNLAVTTLCPLEPLISPCQCTPEDRGIELRCIGPLVTQKSIENLFNVSRSVNEISNSDRLNVTAFILTLTNLKKIDLDVFNQVNFKGLQISWNSYLEDFEIGTSPESSIDTEHVQLEGPSLTISSIQKFLNVVQPEKVQHLLLSPRGSRDVDVDIGEGRDPVQEFIENVGKFKNLVSLNLQIPLIDKIVGGQFKNFTRLKSLTLVSRNIGELGEKAFFMDKLDPDMIDVELSLWLGSNNLTDNKINEDLGLDSIQRPLQLGLEYNKLEFISETKFKSFLFANPRNRLRVKGNPMICDERMKWLKVNKINLEKRVSGVNCVNDKGKTIFTTSLV